MEIPLIYRDLQGRLSNMEEALFNQKRLHAVLSQSVGQKETILDALQERISYHDRSLRIVWANREACNFAHLRRDQVIGRHCFEVWKSRHKPCEGCPLINDDLEGFPMAREETDQDGKIWIVRGYPVRNPEGTWIGIVETTIDITETKQLEAQLFRAQKMEAMGTLAGGIAHDFNNLLQAIRGFADLLILKKDPEDPDYPSIREIQRAARSASHLTDQLLSYSRKREQNFKLSNINYEVNNIRKILERTIPKMISIDIHLNKDINPVNAESEQLEQVLMNLALNARDAMPEGGILRIETDNVHLEKDLIIGSTKVACGDYVLLRVSDTGQGIDEESLTHIFEPFFTTKEQGKGTGLGLSMVYGVVKNLRGQITCKSKMGVGTIFEIYLPVGLEVFETEISESHELPPGGDETILLVDDDRNVRLLGKETLTKFGYEVLVAEDGEQALESYHRLAGKIDLVILDLIMPGMGGKKCLKELLEIDPGAKVVIASGYSASWPDEKSMDGLTKGFIRKPYDMCSMLRSVRKILDCK